MYEVSPPATATDEAYANILERVAGLEAEGPRRRQAAGVELPPTASQNSVADPKIIGRLSPLTDDKSAIRQWDAKMVNALAHANKGYGWALDRIEECPSKGHDLHDALKLGWGGCGRNSRAARGAR